ncbi:MAG: hypothetical protein M1822_006411 [Bathelium mastoideum]|nr:MAG: hypothetical protein M1822_006411 [Bathelium mastoideum]
MDQWRRNLPWTQLSKTFQEAIAITRNLGIQYIWIDSLCILQDDASDWEIESEKMGTTYSNALLVISATASKNGDGGIFLERPAYTTITGTGLNHASFQVFARLLCDHDAFTHSHEHYYDPNTRYSEIERIVLTSPLFGRAWCFQERVLGTKVIHFAKDEIVFECLAGSNCECGFLAGFEDPATNPARRFLACDFCDSEDSTSDNQDQSSSPYANRRPSTGLALGTKKRYIVPFRFREWYDFVSEYAQKSTTRSSDRLPALAGLAEQWSASETGPYLAGLWRNDLFRGLLWVAYGPDRNTSQDYIAPTWSWANMQSTIFWLSIGKKRPIYFIDIDVHKTAVVPKGLNRFGEVAGGWLFLTGIVAEATLTRLHGNDGSVHSACVEIDGKIQDFKADNMRRCARFIGQKVLWLKYCQDDGFERALILAGASDEQLERLPSDIRTYHTICQRIGIVRYVYKEIELTGAKLLSMYVL